MNPKENLVGRSYGLLTVESLDSKGKQGILWLCRCQCGTSKLYSTSTLNRGKAKSCGCIHNPNLINQNFGRLIVREHLRILPRKGSIWRCDCSCGTSIEVPTNELTSKRRISCGCAPNRTNKRYEEISGSMWNRIQYDARQRSISFNLEIQQAWQLYIFQNRKCALSGVDLKFGTRHTVDETTASLDRIDSSKGYTLDNVQWVHKRVNQMKNNMTTEEFKNWCILIYKHLS